LIRAAAFDFFLDAPAGRSRNPAATYYDIVLVKDDGLARSNRPLWLIKAHQCLITVHPHLGIRRFVTMADLCLDPNWDIEGIDSNPVQTPCAQRL
jgi:hypothetical protein